MKNHLRRNCVSKRRTFEDGEKHKNEEWSVNNMLKSFFNILSDVVSVESKTTTTYKGENNMGRKTLSRTQKFLNALQRGIESISWKQD